MATEKKPAMMTISSRIRSRSSLLFNRIFHPQHGDRNTKPTSTVWSSASLPLRVIDEKKRLSYASVTASEKSRPPSEPADLSTYSRPIGTLEWFFKRLGDAGSANREHAAFFTVVQLRFPSRVTDPEDYIAKAWEVVGRRFPALRAEISPPDPADPLRRWMFTVPPFNKHSFRNSFSAHQDCPNVDALFSVSSPLRSTATCYWLPTPGQIVLRTAHWRADGFGQILLTDVFMTTLASIVERGLDVPVDDSLLRQPEDAPITPGLEDLIRKYSKDPPADAADADILMDTLVRGGQSIAVPTIPGSEMAVASSCSRTALRMSTASTAELASACRAQGVSVTSALNAAIIRATARYPQDAKADSYVIFAPVDLRGPLLEAGAHECAQPTGTYVSGLPLRIEGVVKRLEGGGGTAPGKSFSALADELSAFYSQDLLHYRRPGDGDDKKTVSLLGLAEPYIERMTGLFSTFPSPGCPFPKTPVISSLGKMDGLVKREYGGSAGAESEGEAEQGGEKKEEEKNKKQDGGEATLQVVDFWVGIENATPMITFHPWSWADELTLSAAFNESFYNSEIVNDALQKIMEELAEGLKMDHVNYRIVASCYDASTEA